MKKLITLAIYALLSPFILAVIILCFGGAAVEIVYILATDGKYPIMTALVTLAGEFAWLVFLAAEVAKFCPAC